MQWSFNPRHDTSAYVMSRRDILVEASSEEREYLEAIMNEKSGLKKRYHSSNNEGNVSIKCK